jgi:hypothetical protein
MGFSEKNKIQTFLGPARKLISVRLPRPNTEITVHIGQCERERGAPCNCTHCISNASELLYQPTNSKVKQSLYRPGEALRGPGG